MGVERFHSIDEMNEAPVRARPGDAFDRFIRHCARFRAMAPRQYPRGVFRYRSLAEVQEARIRRSDGPERFADSSVAGGLEPPGFAESEIRAGDRLVVVTNGRHA